MAFGKNCAKAEDAALWKFAMEHRRLYRRREYSVPLLDSVRISTKCGNRVTRAYETSSNRVTMVFYKASSFDGNGPWNFALRSWVIQIKL